MAKDPAFLFYSQDFFTGVATLDFEERGKYITILCLMHQQGRMDEKTIRFLVGSVSDNLKAKFRIDKNGLWYNKRLEIEAEKRATFTQSRRANGLKGGRPKKKKPKAKPNNNHMDNHMDNHMEDENENENVIEDIKEEKPKIKLPWETENFKSQWERWKQYRKDHKIKSYKSIDSEQTALNQLQELANGNEQTAIAIINQSIANTYQGLFPLKSNSDVSNQGNFSRNGNHKPTSKPRITNGQEFGEL